MTTAWMVTARSLLGTKEKPGTSNNPIIMEWANAIGGWVANFYTKDEIPWCGLFVAHCLSEHNIKIPKNPLSALEYSRWGVKLSKGTPGAVMVFTRPSGGHVGFYVSEDATDYHILGGNQSDMVTITKIDKSRLVGIRWPSEFPIPTAGPVVNKAFNGVKTSNEA